MRKLISAALLLCFNLAVAQSDKSISGFLQYQGGQAASDVTVSLLSYPDSALLQRSYTFDDGRFKFTGVRTGSYLLRFTSLGSLKITKGPITLNENLILDTIQLAQTAERLQEVIVKGTRPLIERSAGKTTINMENTSLATGSSALDILNSAPGLTLLTDGSIQLNGKPGVTVMLDGKLTYLSSAQLSNLLRNTSSNQIRSIEIMTQPPVKYEASGSAGLINIILKKNKEFGTNGTLNADAALGEYLKANSGISVNRRTRHLNLFGNYNYADNKRQGILNLDRQVNLPGNTSNIGQESSSLTNNLNHTYKAGADYFINDNNILGVAVAGYLNDQKEVIENRSLVHNRSSGPSSIEAYNTGKNRYANISYNLNYKSVVDTLGQQFDIDLAVLDYRNSEEVRYQNTLLYSGAPSTLAVFRNLSPTDLDIKALTANYSLPFSKSSGMDFGIKTSSVKTDNDFVVENSRGDVWIRDQEQSNRFLYKERIRAAYLNYRTGWAGFKLQLGVRAEHTDTQGNSITLAEISNRKYLDLFPLVSVSRKLNEHHTLGLTANRRIDRPGYGSLNPFIYYLDLYTYKTGNPDLRPQYTNSLALSYQLKQKYSLELAYAGTKNVITDVIMPDNARNALFTRPENLSGHNSVTLSLSVPVSIGTSWTMYNDLSAYHTEFRSQNVLGSVYKGSLYAMNFKSYHTFSLGKGLSVDGAFNYQTKQLYGTSYLKAVLFVDAGSSYRVLDDRLSVKLSVKDIFNQRSQTLYSNLPGIGYTLYDKPETRLLAVGVSYSFGGKEVKAARKRASGIEEEKGRIGNIR